MKAKNAVLLSISTPSHAATALCDGLGTKKQRGELINLALTGGSTALTARVILTLPKRRALTVIKAKLPSATVPFVRYLLENFCGDTHSKYIDEVRILLIRQLAKLSIKEWMGIDFRYRTGVTTPHEIDPLVQAVVSSGNANYARFFLDECWDLGKLPLSDQQQKQLELLLVHREPSHTTALATA